VDVQAQHIGQQAVSVLSNVFHDPSMDVVCIDVGCLLIAGETS
jgi:hypothetical protein